MFDDAEAGKFLDITWIEKNEVILFGTEHFTFIRNMMNYQEDN